MWHISNAGRMCCVKWFLSTNVSSALEKIPPMLVHTTIHGTTALLHTIILMKHLIIELHISIHFKQRAHGGVHGRVVRVVDLESLAPHRCGLESNSFMWRSYPASLGNVEPACAWNNARRGSWGLPPPVKLESHHMTFTMLMQRKIQQRRGDISSLYSALQTVCWGKTS